MLILINKFTEVAGYNQYAKIYCLKILTNYQKENLRKNSIDKCIRNNKIPISLTKKVTTCYTEKKNYKKMMTEIEKDTNKTEIVHAHGLQEFVLLKCLVYPKQSTDSIRSLIKNPMTFFRGKNRKANSVWNHKRPQIAKAILRKNNKAAGIMLI